ncbi:hypothetical protein [Bradyrhizobium sp. WSM1417]|nr:hypothetical protein [Bradyrhizobium sp. WSM1417]
MVTGLLFRWRSQFGIVQRNARSSPEW